MILALMPCHNYIFHKKVQLETNSKNVINAAMYKYCRNLSHGIYTF
jgi:hypothetical protein